MDLRERFMSLFSSEPSDFMGKRFDELVALYSESHRYYHNLQHIEECLVEFDEIKETLMNPSLVEAAIFYHDVIYNPSREDNEEQSAKLFDKHSPWYIGKEGVMELIYATKHHRAFDKDSQHFVDIDMSILGKEPNRFWDYESAIRKEYELYSDDVFNPARTEILESFLNKKTIYKTPYFFQKYERQARENLKEAIAKLN